MHSEGYGTWSCTSVSLSIRLVSHISLLEHLFILKIQTQWATEVKKLVFFLNRSVQELWRETQAKELIRSTEKLNTITLAKKQTDYHIKRFGSYTATIISEI